MNALKLGLGSITMKCCNNLYTLFTDQVTKKNNKTAISFGEQSITYCELEERVDCFSAYFLSSISVPSSENIAILLSPSIDFVVAMLTCLKLGYTYIPIDYNYPDEYLKRIIDSAKIICIISDKDSQDRLNKLNLSCIIDIHQSNLCVKKMTTELVERNNKKEAYIIYTSGSTGLPKGVIIEHAAIINLIEATKKLYKISPKDKIPLFHSLSFDVSIWEICSSLFNGAELVIPIGAIKSSPKDYLDFILEKKITIINMTPTYFYLFQTPILDTPSSILKSMKLRLILLAGEAFHAKKIHKWFNLSISKKIRLYNMYGITEGTIHSTAIEIISNMRENDASLIGNPLAGINIAVVDEHGAPVKKNDIGEVKISGISISQGYLNQPELTSERFVVTDYDGTGKKRWLQTGDLVKVGDNGLEYIGRKDKLIKVRGYRVSTTNIENTLCSYGEISGAVVGPFMAPGEQLRLVAFIKCRNVTLDVASIYSKLKKTLPEFMCPSKIIVVDDFPLTKNGKVDLDHLIKNFISTTNIIKENRQDTSILAKVKSVWKSVLNMQDVNSNINFFDIGGDSLLLVQLHYELEELLNQEIKILDLIKHPTIDKFVMYISDCTT